MRAVQVAIYIPRHVKVLEIQAFLYRKTKRPLEPNICTQLFRERLSEKVHATIPKGIVGGFAKEVTKVGSMAYTAKNRVLITSYITFQDSRVHIFSARHAFNSCKQRCLAAVMPHKSNTRNNR